MARILLVDDEPNIREVLAMFLTHQGHDVSTADTGERALESLSARPDLLVIDVMLPGIGGVEVFTRFKAAHPRIGCIFMTGYGSIRSAVDAMLAGADDYLTKPFDNEELLLSINRIAEMRLLSREVEALREELSARYGFNEIIGVCAPMREVFRVMSRVAPNDATVLVLGESGTGKELVARAIHRKSPRAGGPFVAVNCSAIPATLIEAEFFGYERGAFTDAKEPHPGRFEQAHRGTLFLDEVGDLPLEAQAKLLRVLQDREVMRLGGRRSARVDVRVIAATNKDLEQQVRRGLFRDDLYYRLNVLSLKLPALRDRPEDLSLLIDTLLEKLSGELQLAAKGISPAARQLLMRHDWPGNVRELENTLRRALVLSDGVIVDVPDLPLRIRSDEDESGASAAGRLLTLGAAVAQAVERVEKSLILATLAEHKGNRTNTAESLGINRKTLFNKMREYGIDRGVEGEGGD